MPFSIIDKIIIVNDGSKDNTLEIIKRLSEKYEKIHIVNHEKKKGYGAAQISLYKEGLRLGGDIFILLHADKNHSPEEIPLFLETLKNNDCDMVLGSRVLGIHNSSNPILGLNFLGHVFSGSMPAHKYVGNRVLTKLMNLLLNMQLTTFHCGYKACTRKLIENIPFEKFGQGYIYDTEILVNANKNGFKIIEIPISSHYDKNAGSSVEIVKYTFNILKFILEFKRKNKIEN